MATINLSVGSGETKTITFQSAGTYNTEDIVFSVSGSGGDTNTTLSGFAYSNTAAGTAAKTATMPGFALSSGQRIVLYLATSSTVANATLNINSAGAKAVRIGGAATTASNFTSGYWICAYDGTYWNAEKIYLTDNNNTYNFSGTSFTSTNSTASDKNANNLTSNGTYYYASNGPSTDLGASTADGALYVQAYSTSWVGQIAQDYRNGRLFVRGKNNNTWQAWKRVANYDEVALSGHNHDSVYKKKQTAVSDPATSLDTSSQFIDTITQNEQGVITATKKSLPLASSSAAGITKVGASGGAAAYSHSHSISLSATGTSTVDLAASTTYTLTAGGNSVAFKTPAGYTHPTTAGNKHVPSGGSSGQFLGWSAAGTAAWVNNPNTDYYVCQNVDSNDTYRSILLGEEDLNSATSTPIGNSLGAQSYVSPKVCVNPDKGYIYANGYCVSGATGFLKADGSVDTNTYNNYTHPTTTGYKHIPSGGSSGQFLGWSASGTAAWVSNPNSDNKVKQEPDTTNTFRSLLFGENSLNAHNTVPTEVTGKSYVTKGVAVNPSTGVVNAGGFSVLGNSSVGFLKSDGSVDNNTYSLSNHSHSYAASSHSHGSITNGGYINGVNSASGGVGNNEVAIASGDRLVIGDWSAHSTSNLPLKLASIVFDGSTTTKFLSQKGTWETPSGGGGASMASPVAVAGTLGTVIPIDNFAGGVSFSPQTYDSNVTALYSGNINFALPIGMDSEGHLFLPITDAFMTLLQELGYEGGKGKK